MNMANLQLDFYRRYSDAVSQLYISRCGALCTLLGFSAIEGAKSLSCALSMGVTVLARRLDCGYIKIENTSSNICRMYDMRDIFRKENLIERKIRAVLAKTGFNGAEILYDSDMPSEFDVKYSLRAAVIKAIMSALDFNVLNPEELSYLCDEGKDKPLYRAILSAIPEQATYINVSETKHYRLPMEKMLFLCVHTRRKPRLPEIVTLKKELARLKNIYPYIYSFADITPDTVNGSAYVYLPFIAAENMRINNAVQALRKSRIETFTDIVNESSRSFLKYFPVSAEQRFLAKIMPLTEGCLCARASRDGVYSIIEENMTDYICGRVKNRFEEHFGYAPKFSVCAVG